MKILIMGFTKIKFMPYMNFYLDNIDRERHEIHILYWNRDIKDNDNKSALFNCLLHELKVFQKDDVSVFYKIRSFIKYRQFVSKIIKDNNFDFIIILHSLPGILIVDKLIKYKSKFILDYRDSTYERFILFKYIVGKLVKWSVATFVSSDAFRKFLPYSANKKIYTSHNILSDSLAHQKDKEKFNTESNKIRIAFWGFIRHKDINIHLIKRLANDCRFELHYYGREQQTAIELKEYTKSIKSNNIFFHGEYNPEDRYKFIRNTDVIHNLYYDKNTLLAMGNKFYDGIIFRIPQVCMPGSFMGKLCEINGVGISLNPYDNSFPDLLEQYVKSLDKTLFKLKCRLLLSTVLDEYHKGCKTIKRLTK